MCEHEDRHFLVSSCRSRKKFVLHVDFSCLTLDQGHAIPLADSSNSKRRDPPSPSLPDEQWQSIEAPMSSMDRCSPPDLIAFLGFGCLECFCFFGGVGGG